MVKQRELTTYEIFVGDKSIIVRDVLDVERLPHSRRCIIHVYDRFLDRVKKYPIARITRLIRR